MSTEDFSELELDALREIMNIGFGQAASNLSEVINLNVVLSVPRIVIMETTAIGDFMHSEVGIPSDYSMVEQFFFGNFEGTSFLLLPETEGAKLATLFDVGAEQEGLDLEPGSLEREAVMEIGNIIIGACVGKIAEILKDQVQFQPPHYLTSPLVREELAKYIGHKAGLALVFKTVFNFEKQHLYGFLFLIASESSLKWVKQALSSFTAGLE